METLEINGVRLIRSRAELELTSAKPVVIQHA